MRYNSTAQKNMGFTEMTKKWRRRRVPGGNGAPSGGSDVRWGSGLVLLDDDGGVVAAETE